MNRKTASSKTTPTTKGKTSTAQYLSWIAELKKRYRATQIKAAVAVNSSLIEFYWNLGKDISEKFVVTAGYGTSFFNRLSIDLRAEFPGTRGFSERNLKYCLDFYGLYSSPDILQQVAAKSCEDASENLQQVVAKLVCIPWGHHCIIMDKCKGNSKKALFYVQRTI